MTTPTLTPTGVFDALHSDTAATDGSSKGGPLVAKAMSTTGVTTGASGGATVAFLRDAGNSPAYFDDASMGRACKITTNTALPGGGWFRDTVYGSHVSPRFYGDGAVAGSAPAFDMMIDGEVFAFEDTAPRRHNVPLSTQLAMPVLDLPRWIDSGKHTVEIAIAGNTAQALSLVFSGWTVAANGYPATQTPRTGGTGGAQALTTTQASISYGGMVRRAHFCNTDTVAHTVTVQYQGNTFWTASVPPNGGTADLDFDPPQTMSSWTAAIDSTPTSGAVRCWTRSC